MVDEGKRVKMYFIIFKTTQEIWMTLLHVLNHSYYVRNWDIAMTSFILVLSLFDLI